MKTPLERDVLSACLKLLTLRRVPHWRQSVGQFTVGGRTIRAAVLGCSDIIGLLPPDGRFLAIECKQPGTRPTAAQNAFLAAVEAAGGVALVVTDVRQLANMLDGLVRGVEQPSRNDQT
jgi:hypothetical protein